MKKLIEKFIAWRGAPATLFLVGITSIASPYWALILVGVWFAFTVYTGYTWPKE
ncbi:MAG: hypothetical protein WC961_07130 [Anaerovoracaceae bacterium]|jgi:hypothetical protein